MVGLEQEYVDKCTQFSEQETNKAKVDTTNNIENNPAKSKMVQRPTNKKLMAEVHKAEDFCKIENRASTLNDLIKLETYFKHYQIMLIDETYKLKNQILFLNRRDKFNKVIYLLHVGDHYNVIESMGSYLNKSYYCDPW